MRNEFLCVFIITVNIHVCIQNTERTQHINSSSGNRDFSQTLGVTVSFDVCVMRYCFGMHDFFVMIIVAGFEWEKGYAFGIVAIEKMREREGEREEGRLGFFI